MTQHTTLLEATCHTTPLEEIATQHTTPLEVTQHTTPLEESPHNTTWNNTPQHIQLREVTCPHNTLKVRQQLQPQNNASNNMAHVVLNTSKKNTNHSCLYKRVLINQYVNQSTNKFANQTTKSKTQRIRKSTDFDVTLQNNAKLQCKYPFQAIH